MLSLGIELAAGNTELGPSLQNSQPRLAKIKIFPVSSFNQSIEKRVFENLPPIAILAWIGLDPGITGLKPVCLHLGFRSNIIGTYSETA